MIDRANKVTGLVAGGLGLAMTLWAVLELISRGEGPLAIAVAGLTLLILSRRGA